MPEYHIEPRRERLLTVRELAAWFGMSEQWIQAHAGTSGRHPQIPVKRMGRSLRFDPAEVETWLKKVAA